MQHMYKCETRPISALQSRQGMATPLIGWCLLFHHCISKGQD